MAPKKVVQDMVPSSRRSIRNVVLYDEIDLPEKKPTKAAEKAAEKADRGEAVPIHRDHTESASAISNALNKQKTPHHESHPHKKKSRTKRWVITTLGILVVCFVLIIAAISLLFSEGTIVVKPKIAKIQVNTAIMAKLKATPPELEYQVVDFVGSDSMSIPATFGAAIETKATGTAILHNKNPTPQKIITNTRLSSSKGLIYRTTTTAIIPAQGDIAVKIVADQTGANYNATPAEIGGDLNVVAYKGSAKYETVYATPENRTRWRIFR